MPAVQAQAAKLDHVTILAMTFLYKVQQGEKLDQAPQ
jgi:hypothetical protein